MHVVFIMDHVWAMDRGQVFVRLVGADDHVYANYMDVMRWLAESNLLEMIVDKLSPSVSVFGVFYYFLFSLKLLTLTTFMKLVDVSDDSCH